MLGIWLGAMVGADVDGAVVRVGKSVGGADGTRVGLTDGWLVVGKIDRVGAALPRREGGAVDRGVGRLLGASVGALVGCVVVGGSVGLAVGELEGCQEGRADGSGVGEGVGADVVGCMVGANVGSGVGWGVGRGVGEGVGARVVGFGDGSWVVGRTVGGVVAAEGMVEGEGDGWEVSVGISEGAAEGWADRVGFWVGMEVGEGDGTKVSVGTGEGKSSTMPSWLLYVTFPFNNMLGTGECVSGERDGTDVTLDSRGSVVVVPKTNEGTKTWRRRRTYFRLRTRWP